MSERSERIVSTVHARSEAKGRLMGAQRSEHP